MDAKLFHAHLDECKQCRENPFGMCPIGQARLEEAVGAQAPPKVRESEKRK